MFFMSRSRRVRSSAKWDMLRQAQHDEVNSNTEQDKFRRAQHDEVVILGKVNRGGAEELLKGEGRGGQNHGGHSVIFTTVTARDRVNVYTLGSP